MGAALERVESLEHLSEKSEDVYACSANFRQKPAFAKKSERKTSKIDAFASAIGSIFKKKSPKDKFEDIYDKAKKQETKPKP